MMDRSRLSARARRRKAFVGAVFFAAFALAAQAPVNAQPPVEIDFSITKSMPPGKTGPVFGEMLTFLVKGIIPPSPGLTGTVEIVLTDTLPAGLVLDGYSGPPNSNCQTITETVPAPGGKLTQYAVECRAVQDLFPSESQELPLLVTSTVGTQETLVVTQTAKIAALSPGLEFEDPPGNNVKSLALCASVVSITFYDCISLEPLPSAAFAGSSRRGFWGAGGRTRCRAGPGPHPGGCAHGR